MTIENCGRELTFKEAPKRVVILNGTSVGEVSTFVKLGLQDSIAANSQSYGVSDDPTLVEAIAAIPTGGVKLNENFEIPKEQILAQNPDLVISTWAGGFSDQGSAITRDQLDSLGINSYVPPSNCAYGATNPSAADKEALANQSIESSNELTADLGVIFDIQDRAADLITTSDARIAAAARDGGSNPPSVLIAFPGMGAMNSNGLPAVFGGPLYDSIISKAGGVNSFAGMQFTDMSNINAEQLAAAKVDVLVIGLFMPTEDAQAYADALFAQYPQWNASKTKTWTSVSDSIYLGPLNAIAVEKISSEVAKVG